MVVLRIGAQVHGSKVGTHADCDDPAEYEVGLSQLVITSAVAIPGGTRPDATAPAMAPRNNGVVTENANEAPKNR